MLLQGILVAVPMTAFWALVLSFVPAVVYLMLHPLRHEQAQQLERQGIFFLSEIEYLQREKERCWRGLRGIYFLCCAGCLAVYGFNLLVRHEISMSPLNLMSTAGTLVFMVSALSYFPVVVFFMCRRPRLCREETLFLKDVLTVYGGGMLVFAFIYISWWMRAHQYLASAKDMAVAVGVMAGGAALLSYLPILIYVAVRLSSRRNRNVSLHTIFVIYSLTFLLYAGVYVVGWRRSLEDPGPAVFSQNQP